MYKKNSLFYWIFPSFILFLSCKPVNNTSLKKIQPVINYKKIDLYPVLPECTKIETGLQQTCFYQAIAKRIQQNITQKNIQLNTKISDSIIVDFTIDTLGLATIISIEHHYNNKKLKTLDSIVKSSFKNLPKMKPAIKMGIPVKAQFTIPIIIHTKTDL